MPKAEEIQYIVPIWMMLYGTGVYTAGLFSIRPPRVLGMLFIALGVVALLVFPQYGVVSAALSFGLLHIVFGLYIMRETTADGGAMNEPVKPDDIDAVIHERGAAGDRGGAGRLAAIELQRVEVDAGAHRRQLQRPLADARRGGLHRRREELSWPPSLHGHASDAQGPQGVRPLLENAAADCRSERPAAGRLVVSGWPSDRYFFEHYFAMQSNLQEKCAMKRRLLLILAAVQRAGDAHFPTDQVLASFPR